MNRQRSLVRKIGYVVAIALLLIPLYWLGRPSVIDPHGAGSDPGGVLAAFRQKHELSEATLGEIDPAGQTIKFATLGLRGIAANVLWEQAYQFKMKKDWTNLSATLEQIAKLEPNFVSVWRFQGWNLSYNCSAEFDDYHEKYEWVIRGIDYLRDGAVHNAHEAVLPWDIGWFISHKIGKADEHRLYRRLFKADDRWYNQGRSKEERDNWLVGHDWFNRVEAMVDNEGAVMRGMAALIWRSDAAMCLMSYASVLEQDGVFGEVARRAWRSAANAWQEFGQKDIPVGEEHVRLGDKTAKEERAARLLAEMDKLQPGLRKKLENAKRAKLTAEQVAALDTPAEKRTGKQFALAAQAEAAIEVSHTEVAQACDPDKRPQAFKLAEELTGIDAYLKSLERNRSTVNYEYWATRAQVEQDDATIKARENLYRGEKDFVDGKLQSAKTAYDAGLQSWRQVLDKYPKLLQDKLTIDDLKDVINRYKELLNQLDLKLPDNFILRDVEQGPAQGG